METYCMVRKSNTFNCAKDKGEEQGNSGVFDTQQWNLVLAYKLYEPETTHLFDPKAWEEVIGGGLW